MDHSQLLLLTSGFTVGVLLTFALQRYTRLVQPSTHHDWPPQKPDIRNGIQECVGNTPLVRIKSLSEFTGCDILGKAEFLEPGGSIKDRIALSIINHAESQGLLTPHTTHPSVIYEGTVGSTGISLAILARAKGYLAHICMPSDQSLEKANLLDKLGARTTLVPPAPIVDPNHFVNVARRFSTENHLKGGPNRGFFADQFETDANYHAHYTTTGPEIYRQTLGKISAFICGAGTGGTLSGIALYLKPRIPNLLVYLADPPGSGLYNKITHGVMFDIREKEGTRRRQQVDTIVEGIGINRLTRNFDVGRGLVDGAIRVEDVEAMAMARWLVEKDGLFLGSSSAVNCFAALKLALALGPGHTIVTILCDSGARHLSKFWKDMEVCGDVDMKIEHVLNAKEIHAAQMERRRKQAETEIERVVTVEEVKRLETEVVQVPKEERDAGKDSVPEKEYLEDAEYLSS